MSDFSQYKMINAKLKKRFLMRKPNLSEASEQFSALSRELRDFKSYSAYCCLAVARCEHSMSNTAQELQALLDAARLFRDGHDQQMNAAISAYRHALKICDETLVSPINAELAAMYKREKRYLEASNAYMDANMRVEATHCYILAHRYELALNCLSLVPNDELESSDRITLFLLKLYLYDANKYDLSVPVIACHPQNDSLTDLNILLESLLISVRSNYDDEDDTRHSLATQLFPKLTGIQNDLLYLIVTKKL